MRTGPWGIRSLTTGSDEPGYRARVISRPFRALGVLFAVLFVGIATVAAAPAPGGSVRSEDLRIDVLDGPARDQPQSLDATLWLPATSGPAPAVLVAHG